jgi:cardiolipin synthase
MIESVSGMLGSFLQTPQWLSVHGLIVLVGLLVYVLTSHSLHQRRSPTAAISWVLTISLVPYVGLPLYLLFGSRKLAHLVSRVAAEPLRLAAEAAGSGAAPSQGDVDWPRQLAAALGQPPVASYQGLRVHADGRAAQLALFDVIDSARQELVLCTFLVGRDAFGRALIERLAARARAGVRVRLLLDGAGRVMGGGISLRALKAAGVQVALFGPILHVPFTSRTNLRNHRKMVVADGVRLWCGGRNLAAEYFEGTPARAAWRDLSFDLSGALAGQAQALFEHDWSFAAGTAVPARAAAAPAPPPPPPYAQVIASGPDQADDTVHDLLVTACFKARRRIRIVTPYFVPGEVLQMALSLAARRGVDVELVLPDHSNHALADFVRHRGLRELAKAGGRIWRTPYMIHAKAVVIDESLALAGSANLDSRSLFLNFEMMVAFYAPGDIQDFADYIDQCRASATHYERAKPGLLRDLAEGLMLWLAFQL